MRRVIAVLGLAWITSLGGCGAVQGLDIRTDSDFEGTAVTTGGFSTVVYNALDENSVDIMMLEGTDKDPQRAMHVRMYWAPRAGRTPVDERATNATIRYVVFTDGGAAVYSGAGFLFPSSKVGAGTFNAQLRNTALRLIDSTPGFNDELGVATATGGISASRSEEVTVRTHRAVEAALSQRLGYPRFVSAD